MSGYLVNKNKYKCFGCGACAQICPLYAIEMVQDTAGFLYPKVSQAQCISCGLCYRVCPAEIDNKFYSPLKVMAGYDIEESIRKKSASGGAFHAIISSVPEDAIVFGVKWVNRSNAMHSYAFARDAYEQFYKSKYAQSIIGTAYADAKKQLKGGKYVIFIGTPCQIAGLKSYLGKEYENLLCVDLVCHGVPSGKILESYLKDSDHIKDKIKCIEFRHKECVSNKWESKYAKLIYESGKEKIVDYDSSAFLRGFANGLFFRDSCGECPYARKERIADLTIGDCWGVENELPELDVHQGVSLVLVNTEKGETISKYMQNYMKFYPLNLDIAISGNARLRGPDKGHKNRQEFLEQLGMVAFGKLVQKYVPRISKLKKIGYTIKQKLLRGK